MKKETYDGRRAKYKKQRNAAVYDAYISLSGITGRCSYSVVSHIANKLGVSRQRVCQIVKKEKERRIHNVE